MASQEVGLPNGCCRTMSRARVLNVRRGTERAAAILPVYAVYVSHVICQVVGAEAECEETP